MRTHIALLAAAGFGAALVWLTRPSADSPPSPTPPDTDHGVEQQRIGERRFPGSANTGRRTVAELPATDRVTPIASTSSAPELTFEGHLTAFIRERFGDGRAMSPSLMPTSTVEEVIADKTLNPEGRTLTAEQASHISQVLADYRSQQVQLEHRERSLCRESLLMAVEKAQYETNERRSASPSSHDSAAIQAATEAQRKALGDTHLALTNRLGKPMKDWAFSILSTVSPDGVPCVTTVYFTATQAPDLFQCRRDLENLVTERRSALRQFFR
jgi:hypothetical protein